MDPKKLKPQDAFDLVTRRQGKAPAKTHEKKDIEDGFGENDGRSVRARPLWKRGLLLGALVTLACLLIAGVVGFYWFVVHESTPDGVVRGPIEKAPASISEEVAKNMIEANLRAFLRADSNEERLKYVYLPDEVKSQLDVYYGVRGLAEVPLWKIERMEPVTSAQGEIWFVVYRDVKKTQGLVSFQRYGDDYLIHWSAMKAFCEIPWEQFMVSRPAGPVMMRGYLRHYVGVWPVGISRRDHHCFLIEDDGGLFSELAIMKTGAPGYTVLENLPKSGRHPVTLELGYRTLEGMGTGKTLHVISLKHLRWQKMAMDSRVQGLQ